MPRFSMTRRTALAVAGSLAITVAAAGAAVAANTGLLGASPDQSVGQLEADDLATLVSTPDTAASEVRYEDEIVVVPADDDGTPDQGGANDDDLVPGPVVTAPGAPAPAPAPAPGVSGDDDGTPDQGGANVDSDDDDDHDDRADDQLEDGHDDDDD